MPVKRVKNTHKNCGFPREYRVTKTRQPFTDAETQRVYGEYFLLLLRKNNLGVSRLGIAVATRVVCQAVDRNKLKRKIRELFRRNRTLFPNVDMIVKVKAFPNNMNQFIRDLTSALEQLR